MTVLLISSYIVCRAIHICTAAFIVHNAYRQLMDAAAELGRNPVSKH